LNWKSADGLKGWFFLISYMEGGATTFRVSIFLVFCVGEETIALQGSGRCRCFAVWLSLCCVGVDTRQTMTEVYFKFWFSISGPVFLRYSTSCLILFPMEFTFKSLKIFVPRQPANKLHLRHLDARVTSPSGQIWSAAVSLNTQLCPLPHGMMHVYR
jgi:hypothetical protein